MTDVASRELRNSTRALLDRVEAGESITITVDGRAVAALVPTASRPRFMSREQFVRDVFSRRADPGLLRDIRSLVPDSTDDIPFR